jgi:hypothetical protein
MYEGDKKEWEEENKEMKRKKKIKSFDHIIHSFVPQIC